MTHEKGSRMRYAEIIGWGKCVPPTVLSNADLERIVDTSDEWITTRTGIKERRISHVELSELAAVAAQHALAGAGVSGPDIDLIVLSTCTPERLVPPTVTLVQAAVDANGAAAFDLNANCSGFMYSLAAATDMIRGGGFETALIIGVEKLSWIMNYADRTTSILFGDGAGAAVLRATDEPLGLLSYELGADGSAAGILCADWFGTQGSPHSDNVPTLFMDGPEVFKRAVKAMGDASVKAVEAAGLGLDDVSLLIPHQANLRIIDATARRLKLDPSQVFVNVASYGNTSAATIPIALTEALQENRIASGDNLVLAAFGGGLTWAAGVVRWGERIEPQQVSSAALPPTTESVFDVLRPNFEARGIRVDG